MLLFLSLTLLLSLFSLGGIAHKNGQIHVGDQLLAIDEHSVQGMPLSHATSLLHNLGDLVDLKILRSHDISNAASNGAAGLPQAQAIYAKVQRRPRSPSANIEASNNNNNSNNNNCQPTTATTATQQQQQQQQQCKWRQGPTAAHLSRHTLQG